MIAKTSIVSWLIFMVSLATASAQSISPFVEIRAGVERTAIHTLSLSPSPGLVGSIEPNFGWGSALSAGLRMPIESSFLNMSLGVGYSSLKLGGDTTLLTRDPIDDAIMRNTRFDHHVEYSALSMDLGVSADIRMFSNMYVSPSFDVRVPISTSLREYELAQGYVYTSGNSERELVNESEVDLRALQIAPSIGLSTSIGEPDGVHAVVYGRGGITAVPALAEFSQWFVQSGVRFVFGSPETAVEIPLPEQEERTIRYDTLALVRDTVIRRIPGVSSPELVLDTTIVTRSRSYTETEIIHTVSATEHWVWRYPEIRPLLAAGVSTRFVLDDGTEVSSARISIEEFIDNRHIPLLNYVFFDSKSVTLAPRYVSRNRQRIKFYDPSQLFGVDNLSVYRDILNIIGYRMEKNDTAILDIAGYTSSQDDAGVPDVARRRAERISRYMRETFGIDSSRLRISHGGLPPDASPEGDPDGRAENRRVELTSANAPYLFAPLSISDTLRVMDPPNVQFQVSAIAEAGVAQWELSVRQGREEIFHRIGKGNPPASIQWRANEERNAPLLARELQFSFSVTDSSGQTFTTSTDTLVFKEVTVAKKRSEEQKDKILDRYALILFEFDSGEITGGNRDLIKAIRSKILPNSKVSVIGSTDRVGTESHNNVLSFERARRAASALGLPEISAVGVGEDTSTYDNDTPEGRFYSRAVYILIETPVQ